MPLFTPILMAVGKELIQVTIKGMVAKILKRESDVKVAVDALHSIASQSIEFARQVHQGDLQHKDKLYGIIEILARENRSPLRELPEPIGKTVRQIQVGDEGKGPLIDEPSAEVLRSHDTLELDEAVEMDVKIEGVFKTNGACKIRLLDSDKIVTGKITDAALDQPHNVYTKALDEGTPLHVVAQSTMKDGKLHKLFISSAESLIDGAGAIEEEPPKIRS